MNRLEQNLAQVRSRIAAACARCGRRPESVRLVAVTKLVPADIIRQIHALGLTDVGENRVQDALAKQQRIAELDPAPAALCWHLIGSLQNNKVRKAAHAFAWVHSVDSLELGERLSRELAAAGRALDVLVQVNVAREPQKSGVAPEQARGTYHALRALPGLRVRGLMTIGPWCADPQELRPVFAGLRQLLPEDAADRELSMGMSHDFEVAIEEGATIIRVGQALFAGMTLASA
ncbi:MAG: YggS family pyridoxal phosphate-dependent enzyme [Planctomycetota bacterium]